MTEVQAGPAKRPVAAGDLDAPFLNEVRLMADVPRWHAKAIAAVTAPGGAR